MDNADKVFNGALENHVKLIKQFRGENSEHTIELVMLQMPLIMVSVT